LVPRCVAEAERHGASNYFVALGESLHNSVAGDSAYVVAPATIAFKADGKRVKQTGAIFTVALPKSTEGWRITAYT
jgi:hypothetical protein